MGGRACDRTGRYGSAWLRAARDGVFLRRQLDRYPDALADVRRAHEMNPNDTFVLLILGTLEAGVGEHERAIEHGQQILRLNPRQSRSHMTYNLLAFCEFRREAICRGHWLGVACAQRHAPIAICTLTSRDLSHRHGRDLQGKSRVRGRAKAGTGIFQEQAGGHDVATPGRRIASQRTFLRIAAGLEDPSAADALR